jgi:NAD(P)-dependent dehydrogenase (short-subunit alcohol dehydrogenase family)
VPGHQNNVILLLPVLTTAKLKNMSATNKNVVIITGAGSGIGKATKVLLREKGHIVYNLDITEDQDEVPGYYIYCDVRKRDEIKAAVKKVFEAEKKIDWAFINAGVHLFDSMENTSDEDFDHVIGVNIYGSFYTAKYVLQYMKESKRGSIVFMGSDQSIIGKPQSSVYGLTKGAIGQLTKSTAIDYAPYNIRVNCICPGTIETPLLDRAVNKFSRLSGTPETDVMESLQTVQPAGRIGKPEEIAAVVAFLLSDENSFMTGSLVSADGGYVCQ